MLFTLKLWAVYKNISIKLLKARKYNNMIILLEACKLVRRGLKKNKDDNIYINVGLNKLD